MLVGVFDVLTLVFASVAQQAYEAIEFENDIEFDHELAAQYLA